MGSDRKLALLNEKAVRFPVSSSFVECLHASLKSLMVRVAKVVFVTSFFLVTTARFSRYYLQTAILAAFTCREFRVSVKNLLPTDFTYLPQNRKRSTLSEKQLRNFAGISIPARINDGTVFQTK